MPRHIGIRLVAALLMALLLVAGTVLGRIPVQVVVAYVAMGIVSVGTYWMDKRAAEHGQWRTAERTLHAVDLCFGIIGGLSAQVLFRHKSRKPSYAAVSAVIAALHMGALIFLVVR